MKTLCIGLIVLLSAVYTEAKPGESYTLTGKERSIAAIIKADMEQFPELYKGESLNSYIAKFKRENKIGKRKLSPGDELSFPQTLASIKAKKIKTKKITAEEKATSDNPNPLGSIENPVKCSMPKGERAYLSRLRDSNGEPPEFERNGSVGRDNYRMPLDEYTVTIAGTTNSITVYMDMYHPDYVETRPIPGFTIVDK